ncbi:MAG: hypothetical protein A2W00_02840 [Candidatus Eisenbacteria bacterium RBG_16_71_46]|nr:MAG: hypothetical protein A2W00_02840 [Candidatus Eisenbacteria bacterium RBG_16_71_46]OGF26158.1 MAG: hypothetical protein A2V63_14025 [Candidatus Eisenbacteria bacterium RBG_19FT_COMBO_70_11]
MALVYSLPRAGRTRLSILDPSGRRVATVMDDTVQAGSGRAVWHGGDKAGRAVAPGVYFAVLEFEGDRRVAKFVRAR